MTKLVKGTPEYEKAKAELLDKIRKEGFNFRLSMRRLNQPENLTKADMIKMFEDNKDAILDDILLDKQENDPEINIDEIFKR